MAFSLGLRLVWPMVELLLFFDFELTVSLTSLCMAVVGVLWRGARAQALHYLMADNMVKRINFLVILDFYFCLTGMFQIFQASIGLRCL